MRPAEGPVAVLLLLQLLRRAGRGLLKGLLLQLQLQLQLLRRAASGGWRACRCGAPGEVGWSACCCCSCGAEPGEACWRARLKGAGAGFKGLWRGDKRKIYADA